MALLRAASGEDADFAILVAETAGPRRRDWYHVVDVWSRSATVALVNVAPEKEFPSDNQSGRWVFKADFAEIMLADDLLREASGCARRKKRVCCD